MVDLVPYAIPAFVVLLLLERARTKRANARGAALRGYDTRDTLASLAMGLGHLAVEVPARALLQGPLFAWLYAHRLLELGTGPLVWLGAFFLEDLTYYTYHRSSHEVRLLWASHVNHHSSERYNLSTALRQAWTSPLITPLFWAWLPWLGVSPGIVLTFSSASLVYQFWIHTELVDRMPAWFEAVFNTPSHHRVHHGSNVEYLDRNHGGVLIVWDRLFGTFEPERAPVRYGLTKNLDTFSPVRIAFHEFAAIARDVVRAPGLVNKLKTAFAPPGFSHDGSTQTSAALRAALRER